MLSSQASDRLAPRHGAFIGHHTKFIGYHLESWYRCGRYVCQRIDEQNDCKLTSTRSYGGGNVYNWASNQFFMDLRQLTADHSLAIAYFSSDLG